MDDVAGVNSTRGTIPWLGMVLVALLVLGVVTTWSANVERDAAHAESLDVARQRLAVERRAFEAFVPVALARHARSLGELPEAERWLTSETRGIYVLFHGEDGTLLFPLTRPYRSRDEILRQVGPTFRDLLCRIERDAATDQKDEVRARLPLLLESSDPLRKVLGRERQRAYAEPGDPVRSIPSTYALLQDGIDLLASSSIVTLGTVLLDDPDITEEMLESTVACLAMRLFPELAGDLNPVHAWCIHLGDVLTHHSRDLSRPWNRAVEHWNERPSLLETTDLEAVTPKVGRRFGSWVHLPLDVTPSERDASGTARVTVLVSQEGFEMLWGEYGAVREDGPENVSFARRTETDAPPGEDRVQVPFQAPLGDFVLTDRSHTLEFVPWRSLLTGAFLVACLAFVLLGARLVQRQARATSDHMRERASFLATIAHQLKTPVANLRLFAETLAQGRAERTEDRQRMQSILASEARKLGEQLERLLAFSRVDDPETPSVERETIDVDEFLHDLKKHWDPLAAERGVILALDLEDSQPTLFGERRMLRDALHNVIDNAIRHAPRGSRVTLEARHETGRSTLRVRDEGPGIDVRDVPHVFERFYRGRREKDGAGTGLGLFIAAEAARRSGGSVGIEQTGPDGTTVTFTFVEHTA